MNKGLLSIVATPIGNLEDITKRALRVLTEADYILCEDTRVSGKLLSFYEIKTPKKRYDSHTKESTHKTILKDLKTGQQIALISDAGTPLISDPGSFLVSLVRKENIPIQVVPGPSALTAALSGASFYGNQFTFLGFPPHKKGRQTFFRNILKYDHPVVFFESTHRIMKTLSALEETLAIDDNYKVTVARELTKLHEEVVPGHPSEVKDYLTENPQHQKGAFVVIVFKCYHKD